MPKLLSVVLLFSLTIVGARMAGAAPIVSVDADTATPGIQSTSSVGGALSLSVDIVISGVEASSPLNGFELDLDFDPTLLSAVSVSDGGFLLAPTFVVQNTLGILSVEFAEVTLGPGGAIGSGVLATVVFDVIGDGTSALDLNDVVLAAPFGEPIPIPISAIADGEV